MRRIIGCGLLIGIGFVLLLVLAWRFVPRERDLLAHATPIANTAGWDLDGTLYSYWLPDGSIFFRQQTAPQNGKTRYTYFRFDPASKVVQPLEALSKLYAERLTEDYDFLTLSQDGQWALWKDEQRKRVIGAKLDGSQTFQAPADGFGIAIWADNGQRWLDFYSKDAYSVSDEEQYFTKAILHTRTATKDTPPPAVPIEDDKAFNQCYCGGYVGNRYFDIDTSDTPGLEDLRYPSPAPVTNTLHIYERELSPGLPILHRYDRPLPKNKSLDYTVPLISPQGDRIVLKLDSERESGPPPSLRRLLPFWQTRTHLVSEIYVWRLGSNEMQQVGVLYDDQTEIESLAFHPDGKHISFLYKDVLYTVPIE